MVTTTRSRRVDGTLPAELRGTLYRNGPRRNEIDGNPFAHLFDGDGMLSQFTFANSEVRYRNRFVATNHYLGERAPQSGAPQLRRAACRRRTGQRLPMPTASNPANTSVVLHAGNLLARWEGGHPWRLDPDSLETIGEEDFGGALKRAHAFSAHPKLDPQTGSCSTSASSTAADTDPHLPGRPRRAAALPAASHPPLPGSQPRFRADRQAHDLRDRSAGPADGAIPNAASRASTGPSVGPLARHSDRARAARWRQAADRGVRAVLSLPHRQCVRGRL